MPKGIRLVLPGREPAFGRAFLACIAASGTLERDCYRLSPPVARYLPVIPVRLGDVAVAMAEFPGDRQRRDVALVNATGEHRCSPHAHGHISLASMPAGRRPWTLPCWITSRVLPIPYR